MLYGVACDRIGSSSAFVIFRCLYSFQPFITNAIYTSMEIKRHLLREIDNDVSAHYEDTAEQMQSPRGIPVFWCRTRGDDGLAFGPSSREEKERVTVQRQQDERCS